MEIYRARMIVRPPCQDNSPAHYLSEVDVIVEQGSDVRASGHAVLFHGHRWTNERQPFPLGDIWGANDRTAGMSRLVPSQVSLPDVLFIADVVSESEDATRYLITAAMTFFDRTVVCVEFKSQDEAMALNGIQGSRICENTYLVRDPQR